MSTACIIAGFTESDLSSLHYNQCDGKDYPMVVLIYLL